MLVEQLHEALIVLDYWLQYLYLLLGDVLLNRFHVEVEEVREVEVQPADVLHRVPNVVLLQVAVKDDVVADLWYLGEGVVRRTLGRCGS